MNICYLSKTFFSLKGGIETYVYRMAKELNRAGHNIHIITCGNDNEEDKYHLDANDFATIHKIKDVKLPVLWRINKLFPITNLLYSRKVSKKLDELIKNYKIDIIESSEWLHEGLWFSFKKRVPVITRLHGHNSIFNSYVNNIPQPVSNKIGIQLERLLALNSDNITSASNYYSSLISSAWDIKSKIHVFYNGVYTEDKLPLSDQQDDKYILFVGRIGPPKGVDMLIDAMQSVWRIYPDIKLVLIGGDEYSFQKESWSRYYERKYDDSRLIFLPPVPYKKLMQYYANSLFCVFPSTFENLSTVAIEAMSLGKLVIATEVGGFPEIISSGENGILIPNNDVRALIDVIIQVLRSEELRRYMERNAYRTVREKFCIENTLRKTLTVYEETIYGFKDKVNGV